MPSDIAVRVECPPPHTPFGSPDGHPYSSGRLRSTEDNKWLRPAAVGPIISQFRTEWQLCARFVNFIGTVDVGSLLMRIVREAISDVLLPLLTLIY